MVVECIKGFQLDGDLLPVMQGEKFKVIDDGFGMVFESLEGFSMNPGMEFCFDDSILVNNFKLLGKDNFY
jgi:hypothetical protein